MSKYLPSSSHLNHLKKQTKSLVKDHKARQVDAFAIIEALFRPVQKKARI